MPMPTPPDENRSRILCQQASAQGDEPLRLLALACLAEGARAQGHYLEAAELFGRALAIARVLGDPDEQVSLLIERSDCWSDAGDAAAAERDLAEAEVVARTGVYQAGGNIRS